MQHPVGYKIGRRPGRDDRHLRGADQQHGRSVAFAHTFLGALLTAARCRRSRLGLWHCAARADDGRACSGAAALAAADRWPSPALASLIVGDFQGKLMVEQQPMKMAAAEALFETEQPARVLAVRGRRLRLQPERAQPRHRDPERCSRSWLDRLPERRGRRASTTSTRSTRRSTGRASYAPIVAVTYWSFRAMIGRRDARSSLIGARPVAGRGAAGWSLARASWGCSWSPSRCRSSATSRLDLHRDGPPAVGRATGC